MPPTSKSPRPSRPRPPSPRSKYRGFSNPQKITLFLALIATIGGIITAGITSVTGVFGTSLRPTSSKTEKTSNSDHAASREAVPASVSQSGSGNTINQNNGTIYQMTASQQLPAATKGKISVNVYAGIGGSEEQSRDLRFIPKYYNLTRKGDINRIEAERGRFYGLPALDFKLVNNTDDAIMFTQIVYEEIKSIPDLRAELIAYPPYRTPPQKMKVINDGWGPAIEITLDGEIFEKSGTPSSEKVLARFSWKLDDIDKDGIVDFPEKLEETLRAKNPPKGSTWNIVAKIHYKSKGSDGSYVNDEVGVDCEFINDEDAIHHHPGPESYTPPSQLYETAFEVNRENYTIFSDISQSLNPKSTDRFTQTIAAEKSSLHRFRLSLVYDDGKIDLGYYEILLYLPRMDADRLRRSVSPPIIRSRPPEVRTLKTK